MNYQHLTAAVRGAIEGLLLKQYSVREIARTLGISPSTVSKEIRKRDMPSGYSALIAQQHYERLRERCRQRKKCNYSKLQKYIVKKLQKGWSPEQISGRLKKSSSPLYVCHETIY